MDNSGNKNNQPLRIAIIGTEGAGKTVFVTVWSKLLEQQQPGKPFIVPDPSTYAYIEKNWCKLRNGQWPESTPQSEFAHLFWRLKMPNGQLCQINVCDVAGHDIRRLFTGNQPKASDDPTKAIYDTVAAANIVLVIINLKDFITTTESQRIENCANLLSMLQYLFEQKKKVALVFSQWHEYEAWVASHGSVEAVLAKYMPSIFNTCSLEDETNYFNVAAVIETTSCITGEIAINNPDPKFTSSGFIDLNEWILAATNDKATSNASKPIAYPTRDSHSGLLSSGKKSSGESKFSCGYIVLSSMFCIFLGGVANFIGEFIYQSQNDSPASITLGILIGACISAIYFVGKFTD